MYKNTKENKTEKSISSTLHEKNLALALPLPVPHLSLSSMPPPLAIFGSLKTKRSLSSKERTFHTQAA